MKMYGKITPYPKNIRTFYIIDILKKDLIYGKKN